MRWTYDANEQSLYVHLDGDAEAVSQVEMADGTIVDVDADGAAVGIEVIRAWAEWDMDVVIVRFGLDGGAADMLRLIANAPLVRNFHLAGSSRTPGRPSPEVSTQGVEPPVFAAV